MILFWIHGVDFIMGLLGLIFVYIFKIAFCLGIKTLLVEDCFYSSHFTATEDYLPGLYVSCKQFAQIPWISKIIYSLVAQNIQKLRFYWTRVHWKLWTWKHADKTIFQSIANAWVLKKTSDFQSSEFLKACLTFWKLLSVMDIQNHVNHFFTVTLQPKHSCFVILL